MSRYITDIRKIEAIPEEEREKLAPITDKFVFRVNDDYLSLINWDDPNDPIRKLIIPNEGELDEYGRWDASEEHLNYVAPGRQHNTRPLPCCWCPKFAAHIAVSVSGSGCSATMCTKRRSMSNRAWNTFPKIRRSTTCCSPAAIR